MTSNVFRLSDADFAQLIRTAPLVAIDVVLRDPEGRVFLALRRDEPARGYYFVPGGRILKDETVAAAFARIVKDEVGVDLRLSEARFLGIFQHQYPTNRFEIEGLGTHYVVLTHEIAVPDQAVTVPDGTPFRWAVPSAISKMGDVHPFTKAYFDESFRGLTAAVP